MRCAKKDRALADTSVSPRKDSRRVLIAQPADNPWATQGIPSAPIGVAAVSNRTEPQRSRSPLSKRDEEAAPCQSRPSPR
jgi:hypothetical protein